MRSNLLVAQFHPPARLDACHGTRDRLPVHVERDAALVLQRRVERLLDALDGVRGMGEPRREGASNDECGQCVASRGCAQWL
jgi:hypothetical protein